MMGEENTVKTVYRLPPCPAYDLRTLEDWLTDLAKEGLFLKKEGFFAGVAAFEKATPRPVRYRLEASPKSTSMWSDNWGEPSPEAIALSEEFGWEYMDKFGEFHIYRTFDPHARELNTDPAVQALTLKAVEKRLRSSFISLILWIVVYPVITMRLCPVLVMLSMGTVFCLFTFLLVLYLTVEAALRVHYFTRLRKAILSGDAPPHKKDWRKHAMRHRLTDVIVLAACIAWFVWLLCLWSADVLEKNEIPLSDYTGDPPFSTLIDLYSEEATDYKRTVLGISNTIKEWNDLIAPKNYKWQEIATVTYADGTSLDGSLYVDYHRMVSPLLARALAREYERHDSRGTHFFKTSERYQPLSLPDLGIDYAAAYRDHIGFETLVLQHGNIVLHISYIQHSGTDDARHLDFNEWAARFANDLKVSLID